MSSDLAKSAITRTELKPNRRTTAQLLAAAARDPDAVSVFYDGTYADDTETAIFVVKGRQNVQYLASLCERQGLMRAGMPVEGHST